MVLALAVEIGNRQKWMPSTFKSCAPIAQPSWVLISTTTSNSQGFQRLSFFCLCARSTLFKGGRHRWTLPQPEGYKGCRLVSPGTWYFILAGTRVFSVHRCLVALVFLGHMILGDPDFTTSCTLFLSSTGSESAPMFSTPWNSKWIHFPLTQDPTFHLTAYLLHHSSKESIY